LILLTATALATAAPAVAAPAADSCPDLVTSQAFVCRALEAQKTGDPTSAATAFEQAAQAGADKDPATARMWAAAGNLWIAAGQPGKAALALDKALALPGLEAEQHGEALLDRARAAEAQNDLKTARAKLTEAAGSISDDPFYWYFSAAVYVRELDSAGAQMAIGRALSLAPSDPAILFEAGHVMHLAGDDIKAREYWMRAAGSDATGPAGKAARDALALLPVPITVKITPDPKAKSKD
jgi:tetratricopeptide (TPR) repeat protein